MKYKWLNKTNSDKLIIFFNGWGMDENIVSGLDFDGHDVVMFYDYNSFDTDFDFSIINTYPTKHLVAWSMGVMTASVFCCKYENKFNSSTAIAGTPYPIHDDYGIPKKIYNLTVKGFNEQSSKKFMERMFNSETDTKIFSDRSFENIKSELSALMSYEPNPDLKYTRVIIPDNDNIIPTKNQKNYWGNIGYEVISSAHCPFMLYNKWSELI